MWSKVFTGLPTDLQPDKVKVLDLRTNNLFDSDLGTIESCIATDRFPNFTFCSTTATQLATTAIFAMLDEHPQLQIAITGNALATIDATTFLFGKLTLEQSHRLIFICENLILLHATGKRLWSAMLRSTMIAIWR